jgi:hypothetical protein
MNKISLTVLFIIGGLVFLVAGAGLGILYQTQQTAPQLEKINTAVKFLSSKTVPSIVAYGQVANIDGRNLTLAFNGDNITIAINEDATVNSFVKNEAGTMAQKKSDFSQIKKGDTLNITIKVLPDGQIQGVSVIVINSTVN